MKREKHYMIDIETTGVDREKDDILEIGIVEIAMRGPMDNRYWHPTGRVFHTYVHTDRQPESEFAKKHQKELYEICRNTAKKSHLALAYEVRAFVHNVKAEPPRDYPYNPEEYTDTVEDVNDGLDNPKFFIGWNASNFDMPFMFDKGLLVPSYYETVDGKDKLMGDAHYRIYEQTGSVQVLSDMTGLDRKTLEVLAHDLNPTNIELPDGKSHDAIYDCYKQIIMQNGLIKIGRMGIRK
jgi:DNA polymerase III epsilon subunit-like protein